jgi:small redox-active disulfide protein 2
MKNVKVYGPGCQKCHLTEERVRKVIEASGIDASVEKISDFAAMAAAGVLSTPAVSVDGVVKLAGRVPTEEEIRSWLGRA